MIVHCKYDEYVPIKQLKSHPKNRNKHPLPQIERLAEILKYQGWRYPVKVSKRSGYVTSGHGRIEAAKLNGWELIPVNYQDYESDEQEYADVTADNAIASWSELDLSAINVDLPELGPDFDIDLLGIKDFVLEPADKEGNCDPDETPEVKDGPSVCRPGDLWMLGDHRLFCGDSTKKENVERLMNGEKADMVFTDPPYGVAYGAKNEFLNKFDKGNTVQKNIENDQGLTDHELALFCDKAMAAADWVTTDKAAYYLTAPPGEKLYPILSGILMAGWQVKACLVWVKNNHVLGRSDYNYKHEMVIYGWKKEGTHEYFGDFATSVWEFPKPLKNDLHPTMKPVELIEYAIKNSTRSSGKVLDLFLGSGSTLIACEKTNRKCYGVEIDPHYCDVILERFHKFSGIEPIREDKKKWLDLKFQSTKKN